MNLTTILDFYGVEKGIYMTKFYDFNNICSNLLFSILNIEIVSDLNFKPIFSVFILIDTCVLIIFIMFFKLKAF